MEMLMRTALFLLLAALTSGPALAANQVALDNNVFVERVSTDASGNQRILLEETKGGVPGDRLGFVHTSSNAGATPAHQFCNTNPLPTAARIAHPGDNHTSRHARGAK